MRAAESLRGTVNDIRRQRSIENACSLPFIKLLVGTSWLRALSALARILVRYREPPYSFGEALWGGLGPGPRSEPRSQGHRRRFTRGRTTSADKKQTRRLPGLRLGRAFGAGLIHAFPGR